MSAQLLVNKILGSGVTVSNATFTGSKCGGGTFSGGADTVGFDTGIVLGTGSVQSGDAQCNGQKGIEGPNSSDSNSGDNGQPGDPQLSQLAGQTANPPQPSASTFDAAVLEFDFVPSGSQLSFDYVFASEEYNEFVHSEFNDVFGFFVNGTNCALVPGTNLPVTVNSVNGGNPFGTGADNPQFYRNNDFNPGPPTLNTELDGLTTVFTCQAKVNPGVTNHIKLAIADTGDAAYDSNVFIQGGTFSSPTTTTTTTTAITTTTTSPSSATTTTTGSGSSATTVTTVPTTTQSPGQSSASTAAPGQPITVSGGGFAPNQPVTIAATNPPTSLGTTTSDSAGNVQAHVVVPTDAAPGPERILITGPAPGGGTHQVVASLTVTATSPVAVPVVATPSFTA